MCDEGLSNMTLELYHNILGYCCNILTLFRFGNLPLLNRVLLLKVVNKFVVSLHIVVAVSSMSLWFVLHPIFHNPTTSTRLKLFPFLKWNPRLCSPSFQPCLLFVYITIWPHYCRSARTQIPDPLMSTRLSLIYLFFSSLPLCFDYLCFSPAPVLMQTGRGVRRMSHTWSNLFWLLPPAIRGLDISFLHSLSPMLPTVRDLDDLIQHFLNCSPLCDLPFWFNLLSRFVTITVINMTRHSPTGCKFKMHEPENNWHICKKKNNNKKKQNTLLILHQNNSFINFFQSHYGVIAAAAAKMDKPVPNFSEVGNNCPIS